MSQRDGSGKNKYDDDRTVGYGAEEPTPEPASRRAATPDYDDEVDLPAWGTQRSRSSSRDVSQQGSTSKNTRRNDRESPTSGPTREPIPTLGDAFERPTRRSTDEPSRSGAGSKPPVDRQRDSSQSAGRNAGARQGALYDDPYADPFVTSEYVDEYVEYREPKIRRRIGTATRSSTRRPAGTQSLGGLVAAAGPQTRLVGAVAGFTIVSLVLMAATLLGRLDSLPDWIPIHLNAEGEPSFWGTASTLWRIPLMTSMLTLMSAGVAWYLWKRDQFGARFALGSTVLINVLSWIALINFVW